MTVFDNAGGAPIAGAPLARLWGRRAAKRRMVEREALEVDALALSWERAVQGAGFVRTVSTVTGPTIIAPRIVHVVLGPPVILTVQLEPGQTVSDVRALATRLAPHLGAVALRVESIAVGAYARITLLSADPLRHPVTRGPAVSSGAESLLIGADESGMAVLLTLPETAHFIVQGATRSGKSTALYGLLAQLAHAPDAAVTGSDPSGLLLAPWARRSTTGAPIAAPVLGTADPAAHVAMLETLIVEMDRRVSTLPPGSDSVTVNRACPVVVVVLEEYPGLLRLLDAVDAKGLGRRARAAVSRLLAEGAKAGIRVVIVAQRADAAIIGGYERGQASHRLSFRVDTADAVKMLHPDVSADVVAEHANAVPGIALLSAPGRPLTRLRCPHVPYRQYVALVAGEAA